MRRILPALILLAAALCAAAGASEGWTLHTFGRAQSVFHGTVDVLDLNDRGQVLVWQDARHYLWDEVNGYTPLIPEGWLKSEADFVTLYPQALNNRGEVAGHVRLTRASRGRNHAVAYHPVGGMRLLPLPETEDSQAQAINDQGWIAGTLSGEALGSAAPDGAPRRGTGVFLFRPGQPLTTAPAGWHVTVHGMNAHGVVVGEADSKPFRWLPGADIEVLENMKDATGHLMAPYGIDDSGLILASASSSRTSNVASGTGFHLYRRVSGLVHVPVAGYNASAPPRITSQGVVAGLARSQNQDAPFLWSEVGGLQILDHVTARNSRRPALNNEGQIALEVRVHGQGNRHSAHVWSRQRGLREIPPFGRGIFGAIHGMNLRGQVLYSSHLRGGDSTSFFLWSQGAPELHVEVAIGRDVRAALLNEHGALAGVCMVGAERTVFYRGPDGAVTLQRFPGVERIFVQDLDDNGVVLGTLRRPGTASAKENAYFVWRPGAAVEEFPDEPHLSHVASRLTETGDIFLVREPHMPFGISLYRREGRLQPLIGPIGGHQFIDMNGSYLLTRLDDVRKVQIWLWDTTGASAALAEPEGWAAYPHAVNRQGQVFAELVGEANQRYPVIYDEPERWRNFEAAELLEPYTRFRIRHFLVNGSVGGTLETEEESIPFVLLPD